MYLCVCACVSIELARLFWLYIILLCFSCDPPLLFSCQGVTTNNNDYYHRATPPASNGRDTEADNSTSALVWPNPTTGGKNGIQLQTDPTPYCVPLLSKVRRVNLPVQLIDVCEWIIGLIILNCLPSPLNVGNGHRTRIYQVLLCAKFGKHFLPHPYLPAARVADNCNWHETFHRAKYIPLFLF